MQLGHNYIGTEHMLLGIVREGTGVGAQVLLGLGVELPALRQRVLQLTGSAPGSQHPQRRGSQGGVQPVGTEITIRVVRAGLGPSAYDAAYTHLEALMERFGLDRSLLARALTVETVRTPERPGIALTLSVPEPGEVDGSPEA